MIGKKPEIKKFKGIYRKQMPLLIQAGLTPATIADIMKLRLEGKLSFDEYYDTASGIAYAGKSKDEFKIVPYSKTLTQTNPATELYNGGAKLSQEDYKKTKGRKLTRKDMIVGERLTQKQVLQHLGWLSLAKNKKLLERYAEEIFRRVYDNCKEEKAMGFYIRNKQEVPNIRACYLVRLSLVSYAGDGCVIDNDARLVGVQKKSAEGTLQKFPYSQRQIESDLKILEEVKKGNLPASKLEKIISHLSSLHQ